VEEETLDHRVGAFAVLIESAKETSKVVVLSYISSNSLKGTLFSTVSLTGEFVTFNFCRSDE
jgi:hypothetical protein